MHQIRANVELEGCARWGLLLSGQVEVRNDLKRCAAPQRWRKSMARVYSSLKFMRYPEHLNALEQREVVAPVHIRIKPNNHCNHSCWYCAYRFDDLQLGEDIDLKEQIPREKMMEIVDDIVELGVKAVTFSGGGEPLIYKPLVEAIERLAAGGVQVASLTNGSNLKGKVAEAFARHGTWVRVSVDGWDDTSYSKARRIKDGSFTRLLENMAAFSALKSSCALGVSFIVGKDNHEHVYEACQTFKQVGAQHVKVSAVVVGNDAHTNNTYHAEIKEKVQAQIRQAQATLSEPGFEILNHYHDVDGRFDKEYTICPYLMFLTVIGADCTVYTCQDKAYTESGILGSIKDRRFKDFWRSEENRQKLFALNPSVSCGHHCVTHTKNLALMEYLSLDPKHGAFV